jgi:hypothetical protein
MAAGQIDLADYAPADELTAVRLDHLPYELMTGYSGEMVVAPL